MRMLPLRDYQDPQRKLMLSQLYECEVISAIQPSYL